MKATTDGSVAEFDRNWKERSEAIYNHWVKGRPRNQVQLAFRNHWSLFREILAGRPFNNSLEVGAGRGSLSSYFAAHGVSCTLLDTSGIVLETAQAIYARNGHHAEFVQANALEMPFAENTYDVVASIGLLEHFEDVRIALQEQVRVLKPGGTCLAYIVPERPDNVQKYFNWFNRGLKLCAKVFAGTGRKDAAKTEIFRSDFGSDRYLEALRGLAVTDVEVCGMYPLPMISYSPEFPFSLLPAPMELILTRVFEGILGIRKILLGRRLFRGHPWTCRESFGQAFLVTFRKTSIA